MHEGQLPIDDDLVRHLVATQHPRWAGRAIREVASVGTVNAVFRLGDDLCVRLPLVTSGGASLERELAWLPWLAARLSVPVPEPVATGAPDERYPLPWAIYRWLPGTTLASAPPAGPALADDLAALVAAVRALDPAGAPRAENRWALRHLDPSIRYGIDRLGDDGIDVARTTAAWDEALAASAYAGPPTWVHGDLLAANLLVADGRLAGVLDWGGSGTGDPAADLYPAWVLDRAGRQRFRSALGVDDASWARGRGWALRTPIQGLPYYRDSNPGFAAMSRAVLDQVLWGADGASG